MEFTLQPLRKIFAKAGAKRISKGAAKELGLVLEEKSKEILEQSQKLALHANRHTVMAKDIKMARRAMKK